MNDQVINYPTEEMISVSQNLHTFLESQWSQHTALFLNNQDSFTTLLTNFAQIIPGGGGKAHELANELANYHQQYQHAYAALFRLAAQIEKAAQEMKAQDHSTANSFQTLEGDNLQ